MDFFLGPAIGKLDNRRIVVEKEHYTALLYVAALIPAFVQQNFLFPHPLPLPKLSKCGYVT